MFNPGEKKDSLKSNRMKTLSFLLHVLTSHHLHSD